MSKIVLRQIVLETHVDESIALLREVRQRLKFKREYVRDSLILIEKYLSNLGHHPGTDRVRTGIQKELNLIRTILGIVISERKNKIVITGKIDKRPKPYKLQPGDNHIVVLPPEEE